MLWFALRIEVEILLVAERDSTELVERVEAKKDWNEKPGEPFGENALIIFYTPLILCLETKNQNSRLYQIMLKIKGFQSDALNSLRSNTKSSSHIPTHLMHLYFSRMI